MKIQRYNILPKPENAHNRNINKINISNIKNAPIKITTIQNPELPTCLRGEIYIVDKFYISYNM